MPNNPDQTGSEYVEQLPERERASGIGDSPVSPGTPQPWEDTRGPGNHIEANNRRTGLGTNTDRERMIPRHADTGLGSQTTRQPTPGSAVDTERVRPHQADSGQPDDAHAAGALPDVGLPAEAALGIVGVRTSAERLGDGDPGAADLGAALGHKPAAGLEQSRSSPAGRSQHPPRGISGVGGTRGSGEGTGHLGGAVSTGLDEGAGSSNT